jgi:hypothetical protein
MLFIMKNIIYSILAIILSFGFIACSSDDDNDNPPVTNPDYIVSNVTTDYQYLLTTGGVVYYTMVFECDVKNNTSSDVRGQVIFDFNSSVDHISRNVHSIAPNQTLHIKDTIATGIPQLDKDSGIKKVYFDPVR